MSSQPFTFKQFTIAQDRCAMKIGTDGVLLGAWTSIDDNPRSILDIGTGTGVIALMLAQRSTAVTIDGVELDANAYEQAVDNFENSPWGDRLYCYHAHLYEFAVEMDETYDLIVCNPPFFSEQLNAASQQLVRQRSQTDGASVQGREHARFEDALPFELLVGAVATLLSKEGSFNVIIPFDREDDFILLCSRAALFPSRITRVKGREEVGVKRSLMEFRFRESVPKITQLTIEKARHRYTEDYITLVKDFYLKM